MSAIGARVAARLTTTDITALFPTTYIAVSGNVVSILYLYVITDIMSLVPSLWYIAM